MKTLVEEPSGDIMYKFQMKQTDPGRKKLLLLKHVQSEMQLKLH